MTTLVEKAKAYKWAEVVTAKGNTRQVPEEFENQPLARAIEFLNEEKFSHSEIARLVWIRPQMVRNYLVGQNDRQIKLT